MTDCLLTGVGGQGIVFASKLISQTAMRQGRKVRTAETIGMAQRGGSVVSHVRIGEDDYSPLIAKKHADLIIGFEPSETVRVIDYLKSDGAVVVNNQGVQSISAALTGDEYEVGTALDYLSSLPIRLVVCDGWRLCREVQNSKVLNVALVGAAAAAGALDMSIAELSETIRVIAPSRFIDLNIKALEIGAKGVKE